jgi:hypothetical protein
MTAANFEVFLCLLNAHDKALAEYFWAAQYLMAPLKK